LIGPRRSGKGTIARIITLLLGPQDVAAPTLSGLGERFGVEGCIGRRLAIISDARVDGRRADLSVAAERLLSISGEDTIGVPRKHIADWTGRLSTRFLLMSNEIPTLPDASGALAGRFVVLKQTVSFYGREDTDLEAKLTPELAGILQWALAGATRLRKRGHFVMPESSAATMQQIANAASQMLAFLDERCDIGKDYTVLRDDLFHEWCQWCRDEGRDHPGTKSTMGKHLSAAVPDLTEPRPRDGEKRPRYYGGLRLKPKDEAAEEAARKAREKILANL
jgi:putative DNA primase/helicase